MPTPGILVASPARVGAWGWRVLALLWRLDQCPTLLLLLAQNSNTKGKGHVASGALGLCSVLGLTLVSAFCTRVPVLSFRGVPFSAVPFCARVAV